jgi:lysophospholipase L1-like esterase
LSKFRPLIQSRFAYTPVSIAKFSIELRKLAEISDSLDIFVILLETPMPHSNLEIRSPGILKSIKKFNTAKEKIANSFEQIQYVKLSEFFADDLYISAEDGHHFNITGHGLVADILSNEILKLLSNKA